MSEKPVVHQKHNTHTKAKGTHHVKKKSKADIVVANEQLNSEETSASVVLFDAGVSRVSYLTSSPPPYIKIQLDQKEAIIPGDKITGKVTIIVTNPKVTRGVVAHCTGDASVRFSTPGGTSPEVTPIIGRNNKVKPVEEYKSEEIYIDSWKYLLGGPQIREFVLQPGTKTFPISFAIPKGIPCSFTGKHGRVEYRIQVKVKGFGEHVRDMVTTEIFKVVVPLDLNNFHEAWKRTYVAAKELKTICGIYCGLVGFVLEVPHGGFVCDETVKFNGELCNTTSNWRVDEIQIRLLQSNVFAAAGELTWTKEVVYETTYPGFPCDSNLYWEGEIGPIPNLPPTNLGGCHIIAVNYWIQVCLTYQKPCSKIKDLSEVVEIIMGTTPFDDEVIPKLLIADENERQYVETRQGLRYRASADDILGEPPSISLFVNFSEEYTQGLKAKVPTGSFEIGESKPRLRKAVQKFRLF